MCTSCVHHVYIMCTPYEGTQTRNCITLSGIIIKLYCLLEPLFYSQAFTRLVCSHVYFIKLVHMLDLGWYIYMYIPVVHVEVS